MTRSKRILCFALSLVFILSLLPGLSLTAEAAAYNEVAGPRAAGDLTSYIYGDFATEGDLPSPFGHINPWSSFSWLEDGETISLAYAGPKVSTAGTDFEGMGEYGYLGTAQMPQGSGMGDLMMVLLNPTDRDIRVYYYNLTEGPVEVSFHIQSNSRPGFGAHSVASVTTPEGTTALDNMDAESPDQNLSADFSFTLAPYTGTAPEYYYGDSGDQDSKRPADPEEGKSPDGCFYISLTTQPNLGPDPSAGVVISNFYAAGENTATEATVTLEAPEHGSYTATALVPDGDGEKTVTETVTAGGENKSFTYSLTNGFTLQAEGDADYNFDYWLNGDKILSYDENMSTRSYSDGSTVVARFLPKAQTRAFEVNGVRYISWAQAVSAAEAAGAPVILKKDYALGTTLEELAAKGETVNTNGPVDFDGSVIYRLPAGVKFLVPYSDQDTGAFADGPAFSVAAPGTAFRTLSVPAGVTLEVSGKLNVNSCAYANNSTSFMGGAAGDYGFIDLNGSLNVMNGGELRTYGYIAGSGRVNVNSGATSYEVLQMTDWGGGSNAMSWNNGADDNLEKAFYFSQYYVQNVESDYRVYSGAAAYVYGHLTASMGSIKVFANVPAGFIGDGDTLFTMANGYIERRYDGPTDRVTYDVHGDMEAKAITVDVLSIATVASQKWLLGLTNNMDIIASEGTTTLLHGYMVLPDTRIVVGENAKVLIAPDAKVHIWRLDDWKNGYVGGPSNAGKKLVPIRYTVANGINQIRTVPTNSGILEVYGEVEAYSNIFTTDNGGTADDMVVRGTGKLINHQGNATAGLYILKSSKTFEQIQTKPVLSYMYGETELSSFETGTYYSQPKEVDKHGNGKFDSWYQFQVDYTLTDQNGTTINYTDYAFNSDIDLDGTLIADGQRYVITGVTAITDKNSNDLYQNGEGSVTYDGDVTKGGIAVNSNKNLADGWEAIQFHGLTEDIKVSLDVKSYDHRVLWREALDNGTTKISADYVTGDNASYTWAQACAVVASVVPADGATANAVYGTSTVLNLTGISKDVEVNMSAAADSWPITVNLTYPDNSTATATIFSTKSGDVWSAGFAPEKPENGYYIIDTVSLTNGEGVGVRNDKDSMTLTGVVTGGVSADVTLVHKDYKITYNTSLTNAEGSVSLKPEFVDDGETVTVNSTAVVGIEGEKYVFGAAAIATDPTQAQLQVEPTKLSISGVDKDLTLNVPVERFDYVVKVDGQTGYAVEGGELSFTLETGYALNGATKASGQTAVVTYTNPETPDGAATVTVSGIRSDVDVTLDKVKFDAIVIFKDGEGATLATKYYGEGSAVTYTAEDHGANSGSRFYVTDAAVQGDNAQVSFDTQTVTVQNVTGSSAEITVSLTPFDYRVSWVDQTGTNPTTYSYLKGSTVATYTVPDGGVGGQRYIIQNCYVDSTGATSENTKEEVTISNISSDVTANLTLNTYLYKVVFFNQNGTKLKTQYVGDHDNDVTVNVGDSSIRYDVAGGDLQSSKHTIITSISFEGGEPTVNGGESFGEGVQRVTLTGISADINATVEAYEYDHKLYVVLSDENGWGSTTTAKYVSGDSFTWTRPEGESYVVTDASATEGATVTARTADSVTVSLSGVTELELELRVSTRQTVERLKQANFTNGTKNTATINITDPVYGVFEISCPRACIVAIDNGDGTYTRLSAIPTGTANTYEFSCPANFSESISLVVVVKGDVSGDGIINALDAAQVKSASIKKISLTGLKALAADVNGIGGINALDAAQVKSASIKKLTFAW